MAWCMILLMHSTANNKIKRGTTLSETTVIARSTAHRNKWYMCQRRREVMLYHLWNRWTTSHIWVVRQLVVHGVINNIRRFTDVTDKYASISWWWKRQWTSHKLHRTNSNVYGNNMSRWSICMYGTRGNGKERGIAPRASSSGGRCKEYTINKIMQAQMNNWAAPCYSSRNSATK